MKRDPKFKTIFYEWKEFTFEAAHRLTKLPPGHKCGRLHGHHYRVRVHLEGKLDPEFEWLVDYGEVSRIVQPIITKLDHSFLNDRFDFETTAENLAWWLGQQIADDLPKAVGVEVFETPTTSVSCRIFRKRIRQRQRKPNYK